MITPRQFTTWLKDPVTCEFKKLLEEALFKLANGNMTDSMCRDSVGNAQMAGKYQATIDYLRMIEKADYEFLTGEKSDEPDGTNAS